MAYPNSLDELSDGVPSDVDAPYVDLDDATYPHDDHHRALAAGLEAVQTELGLNPAGPEATVADRLALYPPPGWVVVPYTQDVLTNQTTTMTAAINELPTATGGVVVVPAGTFYSQILIGEHKGLTIRGAGKLATTLVGPTTDPMISQFGTPGGNCTFEDLTFDLTTSYGAMVVNPNDINTTFRRCRFINIRDNGSGVTVQGAINPVFEDCEFDDGGQAVGDAVRVNSATRGLRWIRSTARFLQSGVVFDISPHDDIDIDGGLFDGGWYLLRTRGAGYTNSGGTVTYASATNLTDAAASFANVSGANVRALVVLESGSTGTTYQYNYVSDSTATFVSAGVHPGYIVRTADKWAVVEGVASETKLFVEEWFDLTTYRPTSVPTAADAYTVYKVIIGYIRNANTGTTITVDRWTDFHDGATAIPPAGTLYEVLIDHGEYSGIHASADTPYATGGIKQIRVHGGCHLTRSWNDQLSIYGSDARLVVDSTVLIDHGQDYGITCHGNRARIFCTSIHNGAIGIATFGDDCQVNAYASGSPWVNDGNTQYLGDIVFSGSRGRATGSVVVASGPWARHGFVVAGPTTAGGTIDAVDLTGTSATGYSVAAYKLYSLTTPTVTVTNTVLRDVSGVIAENGASGSVTWKSSSDTQTTVGAAGPASAPPATPTKYIKVTVGGTQYVVPAYAVS
jgi:hypothetical protein